MTRAHLKGQAELLELGRLLDMPPDRFAYLGKLRSDEIRFLRELATDALYHHDRERFQLIAFASRLLPLALTALIAQKAFGPLLCARIAGVLETDHAIALADRMPADFLADPPSASIRAGAATSSPACPRTRSRRWPSYSRRGKSSSRWSLRRAHDRRGDRGLARGGGRARAAARLLRARGRRRPRARDPADVLRAPAAPRSARPPTTTSGRRRWTCSAGSPRAWPASLATWRPPRTTACSPRWSGPRRKTTSGTPCFRSPAR